MLLGCTAIHRPTYSNACSFGEWAICQHSSNYSSRASARPSSPTPFFHCCSESCTIALAAGTAEIRSKLPTWAVFIPYFLLLGGSCNMNFKRLVSALLRSYGHQTSRSGSYHLGLILGWVGVDWVGVDSFRLCQTLSDLQQLQSVEAQSPLC